MSEPKASTTRRDPLKERPATRRQLAVLAYIRRYIASYHCPPVVREIGAEFGITSSQGTMRHLNALTRKGLLAPVISAAGLVRGHRLTPAGEEATAGADLSPLPPPAPVNPRSVNMRRTAEARKKRIKALADAVNS